MKELDLASLGTQAAFILSLRFTKNLQPKSTKSTLKMDFKTDSKQSGNRI